jgi:hypothetical protein
MPRTSYFLKIHLNIILPSMPVSHKWSLCPRFPHTLYMPRPLILILGILGTNYNFMLIIVDF